MDTKLNRVLKTISLTPFMISKGPPSPRDASNSQDPLQNRDLVFSQQPNQTSDTTSGVNHLDRPSILPVHLSSSPAATDSAETTYAWLSTCHPSSTLASLCAYPTRSTAPAFSLDDSAATQFFRAKIGSKASINQIIRLLRAARGFIESQRLNPKLFEKLFAPSSEIFDGSVPISTWRLRLLYRMLHETDHHFFKLLGHIYFVHEVGQISIPKDLKLNSGQNRKSVRISMAAEAISTTPKIILAQLKKARNPMLLLKLSGPGSLMRIGSTVNAIWESHLNREDVEILLLYRKEHFPFLEDKAHRLDKFASLIIVEGMIAYGWTYGDLATTHSELTDCLRQYVDLDRLAHERSGDRKAIMPVIEMGEGLGALEDALPPKRQFEGSNHADNPVKHIRLAQVFEERDTSRSMQEAQPWGQFDISTSMQQNETFGNMDIATIMQEAQPWGQFDLEPQDKIIGEGGCVEVDTSCADFYSTLL